MNKNLPEIAQKIATELGCTVMPDGNEHCQKIGGAEVPFYIYSGHGTDKLDISLVYPRMADGTVVARDSIYPASASPNIHVSATRTPAAIAADIKRRFFPVAKTVYAACLERVKLNDDYGLQCAINAAGIQNLFPDAVKRQDSPNSHANVRFETAGLDCRAEVRREDVTLTIRGNIADITKLLARLSPN